MASLDLVTGYQGVNHVTAAQWADLNRGIIGDAAILPVGSEMQPTIQTANQITVPDGVVVYDGREFYIGYGESVNLAIASGTQGMLRHDIVVVEYNRDEESGIESGKFQVIQGTPDASNPKDPVYSDQDIRTGVFSSQKPFCRVVINGTSIQEIQMLVDVSTDIENLGLGVNDLKKSVKSITSNLGPLGTGFGAIVTSQKDIPVRSNPAITGYDAEEWDSANAFTPASGYFMVPVSGIWKFNILTSFNTRANTLFKVGFYSATNKTWHFPQSLKTPETESPYEAAMNASVEFSLASGMEICAVITASDNNDIELTSARFTGELIRKL